MIAGDPLIEARSLSKLFQRRPDFAARLVGLFGVPFDHRTVRAVDDVSFAVQPGEVVGLVGESGCGKSTLGRIVAGLITPSQGEVLMDGQPVASLRGRAATAANLAVQMVFQDPMSALNPRHRAGWIIAQAPVVHGMIRKRDAADFAADLMQQVGLSPDARNRFPHQFSGGQRQRIGIARALAVKPRLIVADEAVASLDVSIQAQIINLFMELRGQRNLAYLFISHDLGVVEHIADRILVMYLGRVVETAPVARLFEAANHPYTRTLIEERPRIGGHRRDYLPISGEIPSPLDPPSGCHFHTRCPHAMARCRVEVPRPRSLGPGHVSACHLND